MAGETKNDNKIFQIVMVVITSIVAPVTVYFITRSIDFSPKVQATPSVQASTVNGIAIAAATGDSMLYLSGEPTTADEVGLITNTASATTPATATVTATSTASATATATHTSTATVQPVTATADTAAAQSAAVKISTPTLAAPTGFLTAGSPVVVNGISVLVQSEEVQVKEDLASFQIHLSNLSSKPQTFVYTLQSIMVKDASGRTLEVIYDKKRGSCTKKDLSTKHSIELQPNQEVILKPVTSSKDMGWCSTKDSRLLPLYKIGTGEARKSITIQFNDFGAFKNFGFKIEL